MKLVTISDAKATLSALIDAAQRGEQVLIMRGSHPAVTLVPVSEDQIHLSPQFSKETINKFEAEIQAEKKSGKLIPLGKSTREAGISIKKIR